jgi:hypothetical protein
MISVDTLEDNKAFAAKEHADFPMLANPDKKVALAYQVIAADTPPERQFARRYTYYIDPTGKIAFIDKVRIRRLRGHRREVDGVEGTGSQVDLERRGTQSPVSTDSADSAFPQQVQRPSRSSDK